MATPLIYAAEREAILRNSGVPVDGGQAFPKLEIQLGKVEACRAELTRLLELLSDKADDYGRYVNAGSTDIGANEAVFTNAAVEIDRVRASLDEAVKTFMLIGACFDLTEAAGKSISLYWASVTSARFSAVTA
jgi:hypothetical protein